MGREYRMSLFARLGKLVRGFLGLFVGGIEENNAEYLIEYIKDGIEKRKREAQQQILEIQTSVELIKIEMKSAEKNLNIINQRIEMAEKQKDKELTDELLRQEGELIRTHEAQGMAYKSALEEVATIRENYRTFESEMDSRLSELKTIRTQSKVASLRENINLANFKYLNKDNGMNDLIVSMDRVREIVNRKNARANAVESLNMDDSGLKIKKIATKAYEDRAIARVDAILSNNTETNIK